MNEIKMNCNIIAKQLNIDLTLLTLMTNVHCKNAWLLYQNTVTKITNLCTLNLIYLIYINYVDLF